MEKENTRQYLISMTPTLRDKAEKEAKRLGLSFSAYLRQLVSKDTEKVGGSSKKH